MTPPMPYRLAAVAQSGGLEGNGHNDREGTELEKGLGGLDRLPLEIRRMIWQYFVPEPPLKSGDSQPPSVPNSQSNALAIFRVSRCIYNEISKQLFHELRLHVCLDPFEGRWTAVHPKPQPWRFNFDELSKNVALKVHIIEPNVKEDPGQLCQLLESAINLACSLCGHSPISNGEERSYTSFDRIGRLIGELRCHGGSSQPEKLPSIWLYFHDRFEPAWRTDNAAIDTLRMDVVGRVINLFKFVAMLQLSDIGDEPDFAAHAEHAEVKALIERLKHHPHGNKFKRWQDFLDSLLKDWWLMEHDLDYLWGPTAAKLRLLRFEDWLLYERALRRYKSLKMRPWAEEAYEYRLKWYLLLRNYFLPGQRSSLPLPEPGEFIDTELWGEFVGREIWRTHFPTGLPAPSSIEGESQIMDGLERAASSSTEERWFFSDLL